MSVVTDYCFAQVDRDRLFRDVRHELRVLVLDRSVGHAVLQEGTIDHIFASGAIDHAGRGLDLLGIGGIGLGVSHGDFRNFGKILLRDRKVLLGVVILEDFLAHEMDDLVALLGRQGGVPAKHESVAVADGLPDRIGIVAELEGILGKTSGQRV